MTAWKMGRPWVLNKIIEPLTNPAVALTGFHIMKIINILIELDFLVTSGGQHLNFKPMETNQ